jgi:decaprenylphospho-beta-D-ribofuranose 2-oxidase
MSNSFLFSSEWLVMRSKKMQFSNFSHAINSSAACARPDNENDLSTFQNLLPPINSSLLARGKGLSYSDCCVNEGGLIIDTSRLNHLLAFDESTGIVICQGNATFRDLFLVHPEFIPAVIPGTLHATVAGGVANDVHGKNNPSAATFGQHVQWLDLQIGNQSCHCSRDENSALFEATIAGLGLTGIIRRLAIKLRKASRFVSVKTEKHREWETLLQRMQDLAANEDYQVAWLDLLSPPQALLSFANHCDQGIEEKIPRLSVPSLPFRLITQWGMTLFNRYHFQRANTALHIEPLSQFNNPLDSINHWNRLYGKKGLLQFQGVFNEDSALLTLTKLQAIIQTHQATPTLAVLKYFNQPGAGLLSFVEPGFTIAIDFINNKEAINAIREMNELITLVDGKIYLAKDLLLTPAQFASQYPNHHQFKAILANYPNQISSNIGRRLGLVS